MTAETTTFWQRWRLYYLGFTLGLIAGFLMGFGVAS